MRLGQELLPDPCSPQLCSMPRRAWWGCATPHATAAASSYLCLQLAQLPAPAVQPLLSHQGHQQVQLGLLPAPRGRGLTRSSEPCYCCSQLTALSVLALLHRLLSRTGWQTGVSNIICSLTCGNGGQTAPRNLCHPPCSLPRREGRC